MKPGDVRVQIAAKKTELEIAITARKQPAELSHLYKELKELQYQLVQAEVEEKKGQLLGSD